MKIVHVVEPLDTGINTFIHELVCGMPDNDHIVIHGIREDGRALDEMMAEYPGNCRFIHWKNAQREINFSSDFKALAELKKLLREIDFDVLHLHSSKANILGRIAALRVGHKGVVYTPNAASFLRTDISKSKKNFFKRLEKFAARLPGKIISSSKSEQRAYSSLGIHTKIIQNGVRVDIPEVDNLNISEEVVIATCGKITVQKNPKRFNEIAKFFENDPRVRFKWIGDGDFREALSSSNIEITGWKSRDDVFKELMTSKMYLSVSLWEGLSLAVIEAMALGKPLLLSDCPGNVDLVVNGVNGYVYRSKEQVIERIQWLIENPEVLERISINSRNMYVRHYSSYRCANEYNNLYKAVVKRNQKI